MLCRRPRVVLISCPAPMLEDDSRQPPNGLVSIATVVRKLGLEISVRDLAGLRPEDLSGAIGDADVVGFATYTATYKTAVRLKDELKRRNPAVVTVAGGPHASAVPEEVARDFDIVVAGEGEQVFPELLYALRDGVVGRRPQIVLAKPIEDLDSLPFPDFEAFCDMSRYNRRMYGRPVMCLDSSRGCNYRCRFCNSRVASRGHWRARSAGNVAAEVAWHRHRGWTAFRYNDDNFLADPVRAIDICDRFNGLDIIFRIFSRAASLCDQRLCRALRLAGCRHVGVGVESMSPTMLVRMGKAERVEAIRRGIQIAHDEGLTVRGFFVVGFPGETDETVAESIDGLRGLPVAEAVVYPAIPYPGTDLFRAPETSGSGLSRITWIDPDYDNYIQVGKNRETGFTMATGGFGVDDVRRWRELYMAAFEARGIAWSASTGEVV